MSCAAKSVLFSVLLLITVLSAACSGQVGVGQSEYRTFRDRLGRTVQARVVQVAGERVSIERRDGQRFTIAISDLSGADQDYLRRWNEPPAPEPSVAGPGERDWRRFRGPAGMGVSDATGLPFEWSQDHGLAWKTALPGAGASSPITFGDRIYLTAYTGYLVPGEPGGSLDQLRRHLIAISLDDGRILWDRAVPAKLPEEESIRDHGFAASTVAVDEQRVYAFFGKSGVFAFDHEGNQLWQAGVGSQTSGWGSASSPVLHEDLVFINASVESESLVALDRKTGQERWRAGGTRQPEAIREAWNTPLVVTAASGRQEVILASAGTVGAFEPATGHSLWTCRTDIRWYIVPSVVAADGVIYCLGGRSGIASLAVRTGGAGDVTATHRLWTSERGSNVSSPVYRDGHLYWAHESNSFAYCVKAATGELVYQERLPRSGQFYASALLADGRLYYVNRDGKTFVLAAKPQFELLAVNDLSDRSVFNASPAVAGNRLLLRSDKYLYCIGPE